MIDLHTHSTASDGTLSPTRLVEAAAAAGVTTLALTDHDCVAGVEEAALAAARCGIRLVPGIELSVSWRGQTLHLVGLNLDIHNSALQQATEQVLDMRRSRAAEIARKLEQSGVHAPLEGARKHAQTELISRTHFAHYLVEQGHARDIRRVFKHYLVRGKPGFVSCEWLSLEHGVELVHRAGGLAVLAHPARYTLSRTRMRELMKVLQSLGVDAIEVVSGSHSQEENRAMAQLALDFNMPASQGSDYHGPEKPWVQLGKLPPMYYRCTPLWEAGLNLD